MIIRTVRLKNFRNYSSADVELSDGINLITGDNAQGKTNFLEALVYLSLTRSHRVNDEKKLIMEGQNMADISCLFYDNDIKKDIEAVIYSKGKTLMIHHQIIKKASMFVGLLNTVLFSPDDLTIFHDSPGKRRKIMNQEIGKISSRYLNSLNHYQSLLKERNFLLKQERINETLLDTLDEEMSRDESFIITMRNEFIDMINSKLENYYHLLSIDDDTKLYAEYECAYDDLEHIRESHQAARERDILYRTTTIGIHREDMIFKMNRESVTEYASQGQKRMAVLSFKLSLLHYIENKTGKKPVLLLDDVLSELDDTRQRRLMNIVEGPYQCIITATGIPAYLENKNIRIFQVVHGTMNRIGGTANE